MEGDPDRSADSSATVRTMLRKIGVVGMAAGAGAALGTWRVMDLSDCVDECHGYAIPVVIAAMLALTGSTALLVAAINWNLRRQQTTSGR